MDMSLERFGRVYDVEICSKITKLYVLLTKIKVFKLKAIYDL